MTTRDLTDTYRQLKALERAITALTEAASLIPEDDDHSALVRVLSDRIETEFGVLQGNIVHGWSLNKAS